MLEALSAKGAFWSWREGRFWNEGWMRTQAFEGRPGMRDTPEGLRPVRPLGETRRAHRRRPAETTVNPVRRTPGRERCTAKSAGRPHKPVASCWYPPPSHAAAASQPPVTPQQPTFAGTGTSHLPTFPSILWPTHKPTPELRLPLAATCQVQPPPGSLLLCGEVTALTV